MRFPQQCNGRTSIHVIINMTVRRRDSDLYGTVIDETDDRARVRWSDGTLEWVDKADLVGLG